MMRYLWIVEKDESTQKIMSLSYMKEDILELLNSNAILEE